MNRKAGFEPVIDANTRLLILGSLPGDASLRAAQYYGHPQNAFWRLIGGVIGRDLAALAYDHRLAALKAARIGLWDVIASAERPGSLDAAIRRPEAADLRGLTASLPDLRAVAFNGGKAARLGRAVLTPPPSRRTVGRARGWRRGGRSGPHPWRRPAPPGPASPLIRR